MPIFMISRYPLVVKRAHLSPRLSSSAFVDTVVPIRILSTAFSLILVPFGIVFPVTICRTRRMLQVSSLLPVQISSLCDIHHSVGASS
jgi:hypothetical protein